MPQAPMDSRDCSGGSFGAVSEQGAPGGLRAGSARGDGSSKLRSRIPQRLSCLAVCALPLIRFAGKIRRFLCWTWAAAALPALGIEARSPPCPASDFEKPGEPQLPTISGSSTQGKGGDVKKLVNSGQRLGAEEKDQGEDGISVPFLVRPVSILGSCIGNPPSSATVSRPASPRSVVSLQRPFPAWTPDPNSTLSHSPEESQCIVAWTCPLARWRRERGRQEGFVILAVEVTNRKQKVDRVLGV